MKDCEVVLIDLLERTGILADQVRELHFEVLALDVKSIELSSKASVVVAESLMLLNSLVEVKA